MAATLLFFGVSFLHSVVAHEGQCSTPDSKIGNCISVKECSPLVVLLTSPHRQESDIQFLRDSQCGFEDFTPKVCCPNSSPVINSSLTVSSQLRAIDFKQSELLPSKCGEYSSYRILAGNVTEIDEYPWLALLEYRQANGSTTTGCGGVLISERYVLTAAHCSKSKDIPLTWKLESVRLGEWNTATRRDCMFAGEEIDVCSDPPTIVSIEERIVHEDYDPLSTDQRHDVALLRLSRDVKFTEYIKPICLPKTSNIPSRLIVAGWGITGSRKVSDLKLHVKLSLLKIVQCSTVYQLTFGESQLCAGGRVSFESCRGDSGGPLMQIQMATDVPRWSVLGIQSFGLSSCGTKNVPNVYTKVYDYVPWIMGKHRV